MSGLSGKTVLNRTTKASVVALVLLLAPALAAAQGVKVTSAYGPVEIRPASGAAMVRVSAGALPVLDIGDEIRTGPDATMTLELPDGSYMVVSENTTLRIERFWGSEVRNLMRVMFGKVRFYIQRLGGRPNPYRVNTPTALIAVRGTTFEVNVGADSVTEVLCLEGRVSVENPGMAGREVVLDAGRKTRVRGGQYPLTPVGLDEEFEGSRVVRIVRRDEESLPAAGPMPLPEGASADNDRRNRAVDPLANPFPGAGSSPEIRRGKLSYPQE